MNNGEQLKVGTAILELQAVAGLRDHPGWKILMGKFHNEFAALTVKLLDPKTPATEAEILRQARGRIERDFSPDKLLENLLAKNAATAERGLRQTAA